MLLEGLFLPLTTPFYSDGRLYLRKLEHNVDRYSRTPVAGMTVLASSGEPEMISDEETRQVLATAIEAADDTKVMLAGISRASVAATLELADLAAALQYDAVLVANPQRTEGQKERLTYFRAVADRSPIPVVLYSTGQAPIELEAATELSSHPGILGLVDETADAARITKMKQATSEIERDATVTHVFAAVTARMQRPVQATAEGGLITLETLAGGSATAIASVKTKTTSTLKTRNRKVGFQILTANDSAVLDGLEAGAVGAMSACAASAPQAVYEIYAAWKDGDVGLAREKQQRVDPIIRLQNQLGTSAIRYAADLNGYFGGLPRLPKLPLSGAERQAMEKVMAGIRN